VQGKAALYRLTESVIIIDDDGVLCTDDELTGMFLMTPSYEYYEYQCLLELEGQIEQYDRRLQDCANRSKVIQRLMEVPGFGPVTACLFVATGGDDCCFDSARTVAAWLELTPRPQTRTALVADSRR